MSDAAKPPDYTVMSGAQFQRAAGADPEKWAEALVQQMEAADAPDERSARVAFVAVWLRDAMDAAVRVQGQLLNQAIIWDKPDENDPAR